MYSIVKWRIIEPNLTVAFRCDNRITQSGDQATHGFDFMCPMLLRLNNHCLHHCHNTLLKIIKGKHGTAYLAYHKSYTLIMLNASRGLSKLRNKSWLIDLYGEDNASTCRCAPIPLYKDWLVVSLINQVDSTCAPVMFSASYLIAGWLLES